MSSFEQKYCIGSKDGKHKVFWNITALLKDLQNAAFMADNRNVADLITHNDFYGDPEYAMKTDVKCPCIVVVLSDGFEKLIDGNHRLFKASQLKLQIIPCYVLPFDYHKKFIVDYDSDIYEKVIADFRG